MAAMEGAWPISTLSATEQAKPPRDARIAGLAARQHGVVSLAQLRAVGMASSGVRDRVARNSLHRVHRGVYAVGHPLLTAKGRWMAAVLACGPEAVLSHRSAAALWGLSSGGTAVDVTSPGRCGRSRRGIRAHSGAALASRDRALVDGIPCTSVARTLLDVAEVLLPRQLERCVERAETLGLFDAAAIEDVLARARGRAGACALAAAVGAWQPLAQVSRSELERRFLALCSAASLPRPELNAWLMLEGGGLEVDFLWPGATLVAEADGHEFHVSRPAFERDRRRDQRLMLAGYRVVRFTWHQLVDEQSQVASTLRGLLAAS